VAVDPARHPRRLAAAGHVEHPDELDQELGLLGGQLLLDQQLELVGRQLAGQALARLGLERVLQEGARLPAGEQHRDELPPGRGGDGGGRDHFWA
jgi:hypothetical protein